jgi:acid stress-induced BolA-like protein IbaG/YrbA
MSITEQVKTAIQKAIPDAEVDVFGGGGHFEIEVISPVFEGKRILEQQRLVYSAIAHLMAGDAAPVHAVDKMICSVPEQG